MIFINIYLELQRGLQYCGFLNDSMVTVAFISNRYTEKTLLHVLSVAYEEYFP